MVHIVVCNYKGFQKFKFWHMLCIWQGLCSCDTAFGDGVKYNLVGIQTIEMGTYLCLQYSCFSQKESVII